MRRMSEVYELIFGYSKKHNDLTYREQFLLGVFADKSVAFSAINLYLNLPGFQNFSVNDFRIKTFILDWGSPCLNQADFSCEDVFVLGYGYSVDNAYDVGGSLGIFSSLERANAMLAFYKTWDIFIFHSQPAIGGEFYIDKYKINELHWKEGFV